MDALGVLAVLALIVAGMLVIDVLAVLFGVDSRPGYGDDHQRPTGA